MKNLTILSSCLLSLVSTSALSGVPLDYVDPLMGADNRGGTMPYVGVPFASAMWVPMTQESRFGTLAFSRFDANLIGYISTRQMAIAMGEWGEFSFQPSFGEGLPPYDFADRKQTIDTTKSVFTPYYCSMTAAGVMTEFTAREHAAIYRITVPANETPRIVFDASRTFSPEHDYQEKDVFQGSVTLAADGMSLDAWNRDNNDFYRSKALPNYKAHWHMAFSEPITACGTFTDGGATDGSYGPATGDRCGARMTFAKTSSARTLYVKVGISLIGSAEAKANLAAEIPGWDFDGTVESVKAVWENKLDAIRITSSSEDVKKIFYSSLYRTLQFPREITENGRYYSAYDDQVHTGVGYTAYSDWDTYRGEHALLTLIAPERVNGMMASLVASAREAGGWLPLYPNLADTACMCGAPAEIILSEAYLKGFRGFDVDAAFEAVMSNATNPTPVDATVKWDDQQKWTGYPEGRGGLTTYRSLGYVACDRTFQSVSRTQDFALADDACARFAAAMGKLELAAFFAARSHSWTNVWNSSTKLPEPKNADGQWVDNATLIAAFGEYNGGYSECTAALARWAVPHDVRLLAQLLGGRDAAVRALDDYVATAYPSSGTTQHYNEPAHHVPYVYNALGEYAKCEALVRRIMDKQYGVQSDPAKWKFPVVGQDDCGEMAAWYVLSALGLYPLNPADGTYEIGSPRVDSAIIRIDGPGSPTNLTITAAAQSSANVYAKSVRLNGVKPAGRRVTHAQLTGGGELAFVMTSNASEIEGDGSNAEPKPSYGPIIYPPCASEQKYDILTPHSTTLRE